MSTMLRRCVARTKGYAADLVYDFVTMAGNQNKTEVRNAVAENAILVETILKEQRNQKLFLNYSINPFRKSTKPSIL